MIGVFFAKGVPLLAGLFAIGMVAGCAGTEPAQNESEPDGGNLTVAATLDQQDIDSFTSVTNLNSSTFILTPGTATFTPSSALSQVVYGDSNGLAHRQTFPLSMISSGGTSVSITDVQIEMANSGLLLSGGTATVKLAFDGLLHASFPVPIIGTVSTDLKVAPSSVQIVLVYDTMSARFAAINANLQLNVTAQNCGIGGLCNGIVDNFLKSNLTNELDTPLRDAISRTLDSEGVTAFLDKLLVAGYNLKNKQATPWTMVDDTLSIASGAFNFTAQRSSP
jgi:hypothetical protein